jgi:hypothetical protein
VAGAFGLVLWPGTGGVELCGTAVGSGPVAVRGAEAVTWQLLIEDRLSAGAGLAVVDVGRRLAPPAAGRAEMTNLAARHVHTLRSRLCRSDAIVTRHHRYGLDPALSAAIVHTC